MQAKKSKISTVWVPLTICVIGAIALAVLWPMHEGNRQNQITALFAIASLIFVLLVPWFAFFSKVSLKKRLSVLAAVAVIGLFLVSTLRVRTLSGDLLPVLEWRWQRTAVPADLGDVQKRTSLHNELIALNDYPQFLGPNRNGVLENLSLVRDWQASPPQERWRRKIGRGWSAFAIQGALAITQEQREAYEMVIAYSVKTGELVWSHRDRARFESALAGIGPHATPTIAGERVFTMGATGILNCLETASGDKIWSADVLAENHAELNQYGTSNSPLLVDSLVIVSAGGSDGRALVAYHAETGKIVWTADGVAHTSHSSPMLVTLADREQILIFNKNAINAHDPQTGEPLWSTPWETVISIAQPVLVPEDRFFVSSGYGIGGKLHQVAREANGDFAVQVLWRTPRLKAKLSNVIHKDGYLYGLDDGVFTCISVESGQRQWKRGRYGHGQIILAGQTILLQAEQGDLVLLDANPREHIELARYPALAGKTWNHPALAAPYLLVRNDQEAVCFELALEPQ